MDLSGPARSRACWVPPPIRSADPRAVA